MTIKELIKELQKYPQDYKVLTLEDEGYGEVEFSSVGQIYIDHSNQEIYL